MERFSSKPSVKSSWYTRRWAIVWIAAAFSIIFPRIYAHGGTIFDNILTMPVVSGLTFPVAVRNAGDGTFRLFVVEKAGIIRIVKNNTVLPTPFLNISAIVDSSGSEQGLLGLAFHPNYASNGLFYVNYTRDPGPGLDRTVIAEYQVSAGNPDVADAASATTILEVAQDFSNHNAGDIAFGPDDGYLYIPLGDGGSGGDPNDRAQDLGELLGKMLRIDVDGTPPGMPNDLCGLVTNYGIPPDNPFVGGSGDCDEIWASGFRNPYRFSFDRITGDIFIGDVGQDAFEEVDFQPAASSGGENYGWDCMEALSCTGSMACTCNDPTLTLPILNIAHPASSIAVTGGFRYRGLIADLYGLYIYAEYYTGTLYAGQQNGMGGWSQVDTTDTTFLISGFGEDEAGELYFTDAGGGTLYRIEHVDFIYSNDQELGTLNKWPIIVP